MQKKILSSVFISNLFLGFFHVIFIDENNATTLLAATWYVDDDNTLGPWDGSSDHPFQTIQDAIDAADHYSYIMIRNGVYYEHLLVNKTLYLQGESIEHTIIDGNYTSTIISITSPRSVIHSLKVQHSGGNTQDAGIAITAEETTLWNCEVSHTKTGVVATTANGTFVTECTFYTNGGGVRFHSVNGGWITDSSFDHNAIGIQLYDSSHITINTSFVHTSGVGVQIDDSSDIIIEHCSISNNNDNRGGIFVYNTDDLTLYNCHIRHNGVGIRLTNTNHVTIQRCDLMWNTHYAMGIWINTNDVTVTQSRIMENLRYGINIEENCHALIFTNNIVDNTLHGVYCLDAQADARHNWWGSRFGPSYYDTPWTSRVSKKTVTIFPWAKQPLHDVGCTWNYNQDVVPIYRAFEREQPLHFEGLDTDDDGLPDWWEKQYGYSYTLWDDHYHLDPDGDGLTNDEECYTYSWDSHPYIKDIFLEIDWVEPASFSRPNRPSDDLIDELIAIFENHNIHLYVDRGEFGGGEEIPYVSNFSFADLRDLYWNYFLHNDMNNPRKGIFRYGLVCDVGPGAGFMFMGWDHLDTFCISADTLQSNQPQWDRDLLIVGGSVHELGHTLGLTVDDHGGNDNLGATEVPSVQWLKYRNYWSCMNYLHTYKTLSYSDGSHGWGDFDDWGHLEFTFFKNSHLEWPPMI